MQTSDCQSPIPNRSSKEENTKETDTTDLTTPSLSPEKKISSTGPQHVQVTKEEFGLPSWVELLVEEDPEEQGSWIAIYEIYDHMELLDEIWQISEFVKDNKHISSLCRFTFKKMEGKIVVTVKQENQFSFLEEIKSSLKVHKFVKNLCKTAVEMVKNYNHQYPSKLISEHSITVCKKLIKVNLIHALLSNYEQHNSDIMKPVSQHLSEVLHKFLMKQKHFRNQIDSSPVLKENLEHFLMHLKSTPCLTKTIHKEHPLFLDASEKIRLINLANDYNQNVLSSKFDPKMDKSRFKILKNIISDWVEYHSYIQRIDNNENLKLHCYNWLKPQLLDLIVKFNIFIRKDTNGTVELREDKFTYHLRFLRNLLFHVNDYKTECRDVFQSIDPQEIMLKIQNLYPRFLTFVYDYYKVERAFFTAIDCQEKPVLLQFTPRKDDDLKLRGEREQIVIDRLYNQYIIFELNQKSSNDKCSTNFYFKGEEYDRNFQIFNPNWPSKLDITQELQTNIGKEVQQQTAALFGDTKYIIPFLKFRLLRQGISKDKTLKQKEESILTAYIKEGCPCIAYSCLNLAIKSESKVAQATQKYIRKTKNKSSSPIEGPPVSLRESSSIFRSPPPHFVPIMPSPWSSACNDYLQGRCRNPKECQYEHPETCQYFLRGQCKFGKGCKFFHPKLCTSIFRELCNKGCKKSHLPVCKGFMAKSCSYGGHCKLYHPPVYICDYSKEHQECRRIDCHYYHLKDIERP